MTAVTRLGTARLELGEGAAWLDDRWVLVDLLAGRLLSHDGHVGSEPVVLAEVGMPLGRVVPASSGGWVGVGGDGFLRLDPGAAEPVTWLSRPEAGTGRRMNDAGVDARGRLWGGAMHLDPATGPGRVHRLDPDGTSTVILEGVRIPNGPLFTADGTSMLLADSAAGVVRRHRLDGTGEPGDGEVWISYAEGSPDGMAEDAEGNVWIAVWGQGWVDRWSPDGRLLDRVEVPAAQPACPALGGPDGRDLLVATAALGRDDPADGGLYLARAPVPGARPRLANN